MCDLAIESYEPIRADNTGFGYLRIKAFTSAPPVVAYLQNKAGGDPIANTLETGESNLTLLRAGKYFVLLRDEQNCELRVDFEILGPPVYGCMNRGAINYNKLAEVDDNSCIFAAPIKFGCTNKRARNYDEAATQDDGSCQFGPEEGVPYGYNSATSTLLVYSEVEKKWMSEQTNRPQMLLPIEGRHVHALPLPAQTADAPETRNLWEHNAGPEVQSPAGTNVPTGILLYGRRHKLWIEIIVLANGPNMIKNLDNLVLVANDDLPVKLVVSAPEQGLFEQVLIGGRTHLSTLERNEQLTYVQLNAPEKKPWGGRVRAQYVRVRIEFAGRRQLRLSKLFAILRESLT